MQRRTLIASLGTLFVAGCAGAPTSESPSTESTTGNESTADEAASAPEPTLDIKSMGGGVVRAVHMGGDTVTDAGTSAVYVTVGGERAATWVADDEAETAGSYPISIGNYVEVEAESGAEVTVVWVGQNENKETLATATVEA